MARPKKTGLQGAYIQRMSSNLDSGVFRAWAVMLRAQVMRREKTGMTSGGRLIGLNFLFYRPYGAIIYLPMGKATSGDGECGKGAHATPRAII